MSGEIHEHLLLAEDSFSLLASADKVARKRSFSAVQDRASLLQFGLRVGPRFPQVISFRYEPWKRSEIASVCSSAVTLLGLQRTEARLPLAD